MWTRRMKTWPLGGLALIAASLSYARAAEIARFDLADESQTLASAAQKSFGQQSYDEAVKRLTRGATTNPAECYLWSRLMLDAESRANTGNPRAPFEAAKAHENRMQRLHDHLFRLAWRRVMPKKSIDAAERYLLEAKALVADYVVPKAR
jgi:hypothetical protein